MTQHDTGASMLDADLRDDVQAALGTTFVLGRELGGGGMSRVFGAHDVKLGRDVAVKVLRPELAAGLSAERFAREIRVAATLQEPHIVPVLSVGETGRGLPFYMMPLIRGESLRSRLERGGALSSDLAIEVLGDVARALVHAHAAGVVHRDIKPENVLLVPGGAMVTDFGIAKALVASQGGAEVSITGIGTALGTPAYMAPEQAAADPGVDHRADLYAWGVMAYEVITGRHPFAAHSTSHALMIAHLTERPASIASRAADLPAPLVDLVMRCMEKDPQRRPADAAALLAGLAPQDRWPTPATRRRITGHAFRLTDPVCRRLDRATLDPRLLSGTMQYLENDGAPDVLLFCVHGLGHEGSEFVELLEATRYRAIAPTLCGFEAGVEPPRVALGVEAHLGLLRELLRDATTRLAPARVVLLGFSSGADLALRLLATLPPDGPRVDACLAFGPNLSLDTCFASRVFARLLGTDSRSLLGELRRIGEDALDLDEWLNVMTYQLHSLRKFRDDVTPLARLAADIAGPFERGGEVFAEWFRVASTRAEVVRCIFERSAICEGLVRALRLRNLDGGVLGPRYEEGSLVLEEVDGHFALIEPAIVTRYVEEALATLRGG